MEWQTAALLVGAAMLVLLAIGVPIAVSLGLSGLTFLLVVMGVDRALYVVAAETVGTWTNFAFLAMPLFILMGELLVYAGTGQDIFDVASKWLSRLPGGLALVTIATCAVFATLSGSTIAATSAVGVMAIPEMLKKGYSKRLAAGAVGAAGGLAHLIPPSVLGVVYAAINDLSVGQMFMAGFVPGVILALGYSMVTVVWALKNPSAAPPEADVSWRDRLLALRRLLAPLILILAVLGSIYTGAATVNEAAAMGAVLALLFGLVSRRLTWSRLGHVLLATARMTAFVMLIATGARIFAWFLTYYLIPQRATELMTSLIANRYLIVIAIQVAYIIMGMFIDPMGIMLITVPIVVPILVNLGFDPYWFGVLYLINMEMAFVTPPFGFNLFIIKGVVGERISLGDIIWGCLIFTLADMSVLGLVMAFPQLALWLPSKMMGG